MSSRNQIVTPREGLQVRAGDKVLVVTRGKGVLVLQKPKSYHAAIRGLSRGAYPKMYVNKERSRWG